MALIVHLEQHLNVVDTWKLVQQYCTNYTEQESNMT